MLSSTLIAVVCLSLLCFLLHVNCEVMLQLGSVDFNVTDSTTKTAVQNVTVNANVLAPNIEALHERIRVLEEHNNYLDDLVANLTDMLTNITTTLSNVNYVEPDDLKQLGVIACQNEFTCNSGSCIDQGVSYSCDCPLFTSGPTCEIFNCTGADDPRVSVWGDLTDVVSAVPLTMSKVWYDDVDDAALHGPIRGECDGSVETSKILEMNAIGDVEYVPVGASSMKATWESAGSQMVLAPDACGRIDEAVSFPDVAGNRLNTIACGEGQCNNYFPQGNFTLEAVFNVESWGAKWYRSIIVTSAGGTGCDIPTEGYNLQIRGAQDAARNGKLMFVVAGGASLTSMATIPENVWHHVVVTCAAQTWSLYIDGVLQEQLINANRINLSLVSQVDVGHCDYVTRGGNPGATTVFQFHGEIAHISMIDGHAVDGDEVAALCSHHCVCP